ncbi:EndoU domain-containing protein, partial [Clostridium sporogenes]
LDKITKGVKGLISGGKAATINSLDDIARYGLNSLDDIIEKAGIQSVDDLTRIGVTSAEDLSKLGVNSVDDLAKLGINNIDELRKLGILPEDLSKIGIKINFQNEIPRTAKEWNEFLSEKYGPENVTWETKELSNPSTKISSEMEKKILEGQRKSPTKNEVIGGHSSSINNNNSNFAVEELSINPDGTKNIKFIKDLQDGNISKIKKSTVFPDSWNDSKIIDSIKNVGDSPTVSVRQRDGATWHRQIIDGVEIDVIKLGDDVISGYPTGKINAPKPSGF